MLILHFLAIFFSVWVGSWIGQAMGQAFAQQWLMKTWDLRSKAVVISQRVFDRMPPCNMEGDFLLPACQKTVKLLVSGH